MLGMKYFKDLTAGVTVGEMINILKDYPQDAQFTVMGNPMIYLHGEEDGSIVIIDDSSLDDAYELENSNERR